MSNQSKYALYQLGEVITTLADKIDLVRVEYDVTNSEVIAHVRQISVAEAALRQEAVNDKINFEGIIIKEA